MNLFNFVTFLACLFTLLTACSPGEGNPGTPPDVGGKVVPYESPVPVEISARPHTPLYDGALVEGIVEKKGSNYSIELSDKRTLDLEVVQLWMAHSPIFDALVGQKVQVRGALFPAYAPGLAGEGKRIQLRLSKVEVLSEALAQRHTLNGAPPATDLKVLNALIGRQRSMKGRLRISEIPGAERAFLEFPDHSVVHLKVSGVDLGGLREKFLNQEVVVSGMLFAGAEPAELRLGNERWLDALTLHVESPTGLRMP